MYYRRLRAYARENRSNADETQQSAGRSLFSMPFRMILMRLFILFTSLPSDSALLGSF
jgi:hypothetical protein